MTQLQPTALVTGAGRGIGASTARTLAAAGHPVGLLARTAAQVQAVADEIRAAGGSAHPVACDIIEPDQVAAAVAEVEDALGGCGVLVNNAGVPGSTAPFLESDFADWWRVFETNIKGTACVTAAVARSMVRRGGGYIVTITSLQASKVSGAGLAYGSSKAALMRFTESLDAELADAGVIVFDLSPGLVRTQMTSGRPDLDALPAQAWNPAQLTGQYVLRLISGEYDELHGRVLRVTDDLDALRKVVAGDPDARILRVQQPKG